MILEVSELNEIWEKIKPILQLVLQSGFITTALYAIERVLIVRLFNKNKHETSIDIATMGNNLLQKVGNSTIKVDLKPLVDNQFKHSLAEVETYITDSIKAMQKAQLERETLRDKVIIDMANVFANAYGIGEEEKKELIKDVKALQECGNTQEKELKPAVLTIQLEDEKEVAEQDIEVEDTLTLDR